MRGTNGSSLLLALYAESMISISAPSAQARAIVLVIRARDSPFDLAQGHKLVEW